MSNRQMSVLRPTGSTGAYSTTVTSTPSVPKTATSEAALLATLNASGLCAWIISRPADVAEAPPRLTLGMAGGDSADTTIIEDVYAVTPYQPTDGGAAIVRIEKLLSATWTLGSTDITVQGAALKECKAVTVVDDGLLEARTGKAATAISREPATVELFDTANASILRVVKRGTAASGAPVSRTWE